MDFCSVKQRFQCAQPCEAAALRTRQVSAPWLGRQLVLSACYLLQLLSCLVSVNGFGGRWVRCVCAGQLCLLFRAGQCRSCQRDARCARRCRPVSSLAGPALSLFRARAEHRGGGNGATPARHRRPGCSRTKSQSCSPADLLLRWIFKETTYKPFIP